MNETTRKAYLRRGIITLIASFILGLLASFSPVMDFWFGVASGITGMTGIILTGIGLLGDLE